MDYNSISYFCEFVNTISWIFWKQQEGFRNSGSRLSDGRPFCLFSSNEKIIQNILQKPLDNTEFVWYNTKLQYNRITMGNSALRQVSRSKRGDFWRRSLCNLTKARSLRSIRLRPRHLKCPWVVRLTHEVSDVRVSALLPVHGDGLIPLLPLPPLGNPPDGVHLTILNGVIYSWSI